MVLNKFIAAAVIVLSLASCKQEKQSDDDSLKTISASGDTITLASNSAILSKLELQTLKPQEYISEYTTTGTIAPLSGHMADVSTPFDGRIIGSDVKLGDKVSAGSALFEVNSSDYFEAVKTFLQAKQAKQLSEKNYLRKKELLEHGVSSKKEYEEAETDFKLSQEEYKKSEESLHIFNILADDLNSAKPLVVRAPISGEVVKSTITVGQYQKADDLPIVTIADLEKVWVVARVKEKNIGQVNRQDNVRVTLECLPGKSFSGSVSYIGNIVDEQTRSIDVYIECENHEKTLKPGMFASACFSHKLTNVLIIPASAVLQQDDKTYVFVQIGKNIFCKKTVSVASDENDKNLLVYSGLTSGDTVVVEGGIYLR